MAKKRRARKNSSANSRKMTIAITAVVVAILALMLFFALRNPVHANPCDDSCNRHPVTGVCHCHGHCDTEGCMCHGAHDH